VRPAPPRLKGRGSGVSSPTWARRAHTRIFAQQPELRPRARHGRRTLLRPGHGKSSNYRRPPAMATGHRRRRRNHRGVLERNPTAYSISFVSYSILRLCKATQCLI
jgi:hypothetical protein